MLWHSLILRVEELIVYLIGALANAMQYAEYGPKSVPIAVVK
jgi:hypothetical protein